MANQRTRTVLVADDEPQLVMLLQASMSRAPFEILTAADGVEALAVARQRHPDVVLLDGAMPMLDGFEVCRQLKTAPETTSIKVVMLTARGTDADRARGREVGADDYFAKPFSPIQLLKRVYALLE